MKLIINPMNARSRNKYYPDDQRPEDIKRNYSCTQCRLSYLVIENTGVTSHRNLVPTKILKLERHCTHFDHIVNIEKANSCERYTEQFIYKKL